MSHAFATTIQTLVLPPEGFPKELYFRGQADVTRDDAPADGAASTPAPALRIPAGQTITLDTYFNTFAAFKWAAYTTATDLAVEVTLRGAATVELVGISRADLACEEVLCVRACASDGSAPVRILACDDLSQLPDFLCLRVRAAEGRDADGAAAEPKPAPTVTLLRVDFLTSAEPREDLNIACCFCTFRREEDIRRNVENLLGGIVHDPRSPLRERLHVYVADNGQTLAPNPWAGEPAVHLFPNRNYGGSAGFTRCMIEARFRNPGRPFTHVILMDDDALIFPEVVERTAALVGLVRDEYREHMVGGAMLYKEAPARQAANGLFEDVRGQTLTACGLDVDLGEKQAALRNDLSEPGDVNFGGWYFSCIPVEFIREDNLPIPFFIHHDDQEYGLRNEGRFLRMNGICIWHPKLSGIGKTKPTSNYYSNRNALVVQAIYCPERTVGQTLGKLVKGTVSSLTQYRYQAVPYDLRAVADFYAGIDAFKDIEPEELNRELMASAPYERCQLAPEELADVITSAPEISSAKRKLGRILNWLVPAWRGRVAYSELVDGRAVDFFGARELCIVNPATGEGLVFRKSYRQAFACVGQLLRTCALVTRRHKAVFAEWHARVGELRTLEFWKGYLGL